MRQPTPLVSVFFAAALIATEARAQIPPAAARASWSAYTQALAAPSSAVGASLGLDFRLPLVTGSFAALMALQPALTPAVLSAEPAPKQTAAIQAAIRGAAAPLLAPAGPGVKTVASLSLDVLVQLDALGGALTPREQTVIAAGVKAEMARRDQSLLAAEQQASADFAVKSAAPPPMIIIPLAESPVHPRVAKTPPVSTLESAPSRSANAPSAPPPAAIAANPFAAIIPKVSLKQLEAKLAEASVGGTTRAPLGKAGAADGIDAVAQKTVNGASFYAEKRYDAQAAADAGVAALRMAKRLENEKTLPGFDVADVLSAPPKATTIRLSLAEGLDMGRIRGSKKASGPYARIIAKYDAALKATSSALESAGWKTTLSKDTGSLYVYGPPGAATPKLAFQLVPANVVATTDGRFVLIDPL